VTYSTIGYIGVASKYPGPQPEWGAMLAYYQSGGLLGSEPWLVLAPGAAIFITVLAFSLLGDGLRDILDPRTRRAFVRNIGTHDPPKEAPDTAAAPAPDAPDTPEAPLASPGAAG
jgi:hypothetical protein